MIPRTPCILIFAYCAYRSLSPNTPCIGSLACCAHRFLVFLLSATKRRFMIPSTRSKLMGRAS
eukprot:428103-Rhodomonas_salina.5